MNHLYAITLATAILCLLPLQALNAAESRPDSGLKYSAIKSANTQSNTKHIKIKSIGAPETKTDAPQTDNTATDILSRVWKNYNTMKSNSEAESAQTMKTAIPANTAKISKPTQPEPGTQPKQSSSSPGSLSALLESYRRNKESRKELRHIEISPKSP
jgi:hypothetical protein